MNDFLSAPRDGVETWEHTEKEEKELSLFDIKCRETTSVSIEESQNLNEEILSLNEGRV